MGANNSKSDHQSQNLQKILSSYVIKTKIHDHNFGEITILTDNKTSKDVFLKEIICSDQKTYEETYRKLESRKQLCHQNVLNLLDLIGQQETNLCSSIFKIFAIFEYSRSTLFALIQQKINGVSLSNQLPTEQEMWLYTRQLVSGLAFLQSYGLFHGDLKPETIFVTNNCKLIEHSIFNDESSYHKILNAIEPHRSFDAYFSPKLLWGLQFKQVTPTHNVFKSDAFSLGMTLLNIATLESSDKYYDITNFGVSFSMIQDTITQLQKRLSKIYTDFLMLMLNPEEDHRFDFIQLHHRLEMDISIQNQMSRLQVDPLNQLNPQYADIKVEEQRGSHKIVDDLQGHVQKIIHPYLDIQLDSKIDKYSDPQVPSYTDNLKLNTFEPYPINPIVQSSTVRLYNPNSDPLKVYKYLYSIIIILYIQIINKTYINQQIFINIYQ